MTPEQKAAELAGALPCPFCGSTRIVKGERYFAMCVDCGATGPERTADASVKKFTGDWNSRHFAASPNVTSPSETEGRTAIHRIAVPDEAAKLRASLEQLNKAHIATSDEAVKLRAKVQELEKDKHAP